MESGASDHRGCNYYSDDNPLFRDEVFQTILKFCSLEDVKRVRLVCKLWSDLSLPFWRNNAILQIVEKKEEDGKHELVLCEFLERFQNRRDFYQMKKLRFQKYKLEEWHLSLENVDQSRFWRKLGTGINQLELRKCYFSNFNFLEGQFLQMFPNLEILILNGNTYNENIFRTWKIRKKICHEKLRMFEITEKPSHIHWKNIFQVFPNIEEIKTSQECEPEEKPENSFLEGVNSARQATGDKTTANLTKVDIMDRKLSSSEYFSFKEAHQLRSFFPKMTFKSLDVGKYTDVSVVRSLLVGEHLKVLHLFRAPVTVPYVDFPFHLKMDALTELHMWGPFVKDLMFLEFTPNLRHLTLDTGAFDKRHKLSVIVDKNWRKLYKAGGNIVKHTKVRLAISDKQFFKFESLQSFKVDVKLTKEDVKMLGKWFPNLKEFKAIVKVDAIPEICNSWPELTGIGFGFGSEVDDNSVILLAKKLSELMQFELEVTCNAGRLTDICVNEGFYKMSLLQKVNMCVSEKFSESGETMMTRKIRDVTIHRNYGNHNHDCCKWKDYMMCFSAQPLVGVPSTNVEIDPWMKREMIQIRVAMKQTEIKKKKNSHVGHPLEDEKVLSKIFSFCSFLDLKRFRLVSKCWFSSSLLQWRENVVVPVRQNFCNAVLSGISLNHLISPYDKSNILQLDVYPYKNYKLEEWKKSGEGFQEHDLFFTVFGYFIRTLELNKCDFQGDLVEEKRFYRKLPQLEKLVLIGEDGEKPEMNFKKGLDFKTSLKSLKVVGYLSKERLSRILCFAPDIKEIVIYLKGKVGYYGDILKAINSVRKLKTEGLGICTLDILNWSDSTFPEFPMGNLKLFQKLNLPLTTFTIDIGYTTSFEIVKTLVELHSETLKVLKLFRAPLKAIFNESIFQAEMGSLKELHLWGRICKNLTFLKFTPNLQILRLNFGCFEKREKFKEHDNLWLEEVDILESASDHDNIQAVRSLQRFEVDQKLSPLGVTRLSKLMPNLTELKAVLNNKSLSLVSHYWKYLEVLGMLFGSELDDEGVVSSLQKLTYLRCFRLETFCNQGKLTDKCEKGFLSFNYLQQLDICVSREMSRSTEITLKNAIGNVKIHENYGYHQNDCCARLEYQSRKLSACKVRKRKYSGDASPSDVKRVRVALQPQASPELVLEDTEIIERIFKFCSLDDIKCLRQVSKSWYLVSQKWVRVAKHKNYRIKNWQISSFPNYFWENIKHWMVSMEMEDCEISMGENDMLSFFTRLHNLTRLTLFCNKLLEPGRIMDKMKKREFAKSHSQMKLKSLKIIGKQWKLCAEHFLLIFHNLEELTLVSQGTSDMTSDDSFMNALFLLTQKEGDRRKLKMLNILHGFNDAIDLLPWWHGKVLNAGFPLKSLSFDVGYRTCGSEIKGILEGNLALEELTMFRAPFQGPFVLPIFKVLMENLTLLELQGSVVRCLNFLSWMPNLQEVSIRMECFEHLTKLERILARGSGEWKLNHGTDPDNVNIVMRTGKIPVMKFLKRFEIDRKLCPMSLKRLAVRMPRLKVLKTVLTQESLEIVKEFCPKLETLVMLFGSELEDTGVVGGLIGLKQLKRFTFQADCDMGKLTSTSVLDGFLKMKGLQQLEICVSPMMGEVAIKELERKISQLKIIRNYGPRHSYDCCTRAKYLELVSKSKSPKSVFLAQPPSPFVPSARPSVSVPSSRILTPIQRFRMSTHVPFPRFGPPRRPSQYHPPRVLEPLQYPELGFPPQVQRYNPSPRRNHW